MEPNLQVLLEEHLGLFLFALFLGIVTCFIAWYRSYFKLPSFSKGNIKITLGLVVLAFVIYFAVSFITPYIILFIIRFLPQHVREGYIAQAELTALWLNVIVMGSLFLLFVIFVSSIRLEIRKWILGTNFYQGIYKAVSNFGMGMLTWLISFPIVTAVSQAASILLLLLHLQSKEQLAVKYLKYTMEYPVLFWLSSLFVILLGPIVEELLFRGFLQNWVTKYLGRGWGIFLTSIAFSCMHYSGSQGWSNVAIIPTLFALSCFLGFIYYRQNSIYASIGLHATFNGVNVFFMSM